MRLELMIISFKLDYTAWKKKRKLKCCSWNEFNFWINNGLCIYSIKLLIFRIEVLKNSALITFEANVLKIDWLVMCLKCFLETSFFLIDAKQWWTNELWAINNPQLMFLNVWNGFTFFSFFIKDTGVYHKWTVPTDIQL